MILIVAFWPLLTAPPSQTTVMGVPLDVQANRLVVSNGVVAASVTPAGSVSTTRTFAVFADPTLLTVRV